jgi:small subunit ribosomal protein S17
MADEQDTQTPQDADAATDAPSSEAAPDATPAVASAPAAPAEPAEQLSPKERRRKSRSTHRGRARDSRTPEERQAERVAERRRKAARRRARRQQERAKRAAAGTGAAAPAPVAAVTREPGTRKMRQGIVVSDKADKTITVRIDVARRHRRYEKIVRSSNTLHAHDEGNEAHEGDTVRVVESRPLSRTKRWRLVEVLQRAR